MLTTLMNTRNQLSWVRRASAVAMARGDGRPTALGGSVLGDVRMERRGMLRRPLATRPPR